MASRDDIDDRDHAAGAAEGLQVRHLSDGGERRRSGALLDRAAAPRHPAARQGARPAPACAHGARDAPDGQDRHRHRGRDRGLCRASRPGAARPGSTSASAGSTATCSSSAIATPSKCGTSDRLVGGLYGVALNGAFFGESMFSYERDASKIALVYLVARLIAGGFRCSIRSSSPTICASSAPSSSTARSSTDCSKRHSTSKPTSTRCRSMPPAQRFQPSSPPSPEPPPPRFVSKGTGGETHRCQISAIAARLARAKEHALGAGPIPETTD